jgi:hypothetical protein
MDSIWYVIIFGYAFVFILLAVLGIMGSFEAIDYQNKIARQKKLTESFDRAKQMEFKFDK